MNSSVERTRVGKFELGKTLGEGTFAKVKVARDINTGLDVAIKILDKEKILKHKMVEQIKREISTMKLVKHPYVVQLLEVMASRTKIYIVLEYVTGGELFNKIAEQGRLLEDEARKYFHQLIDAVDFCHSRQVYHRDLKPENLLLDAKGNLKISDFGLSALPQQFREDGLLHTTCGTPNYVAPEVIMDKGYSGSTADLWSCGVILYVLMAGYLPFEEPTIMALYKKIYRAQFSWPPWFSSGARKLLLKILDPNPNTGCPQYVALSYGVIVYYWHDAKLHSDPVIILDNPDRKLYYLKEVSFARITAAQIHKNDWFRKGYTPAKFDREADISFDDVDAIFSESTRHMVTEKKEARPVTMNAFELISLSQGLNLSGLFESKEIPEKEETRFTSKKSAKEIIESIEEAAKPLGFNVQKRDYKMKLRGDKLGRKGHLSVSTEVFEVAPSLFMVELQKHHGDTLEYNHFYKNLSKGLKDIVWKADLVGGASTLSN